MSYRNFEELALTCRSRQTRRTIAVVCADCEHTLEAVLRAWREELVKPILIGSKEDIVRKLNKLGCQEALPILEAGTPEQAVGLAIDLVHKGLADAVFKGRLETAVLMRAIVRGEKGMLPPGAVMSHITMLEIPSYHKLVGITDGALVTYPTLEQKKAVVQNGVNYLRAIGFDSIKVAVLAAVEKENPKMPETVDAVRLKEMNAAGEISGCCLEGPISYDLAMKPGAAEDKGYQSSVAGDADLLVAPNITAGNLLIKSLTCSAGARGAGLVLGAKVPVILTSRSTAATGKYWSIVLASAI